LKSAKFCIGGRQLEKPSTWTMQRAPGAVRQLSSPVLQLVPNAAAKPVRPVALAALAELASPSLPRPAPPSGTELLPHRQRAAARRAAQAPADPTFVPRNPGITDGPWSTSDDEVVQAALTDARKVAKQATTVASASQGSGLVLLGSSLGALERLAERYGQPRYRAQQLQDAVLNGAHSLQEMPTLPKEWRAQLAGDGVRTGRSNLHHSVVAADGTRKFLLQLADGRLVEAVGIVSAAPEPPPEPGPVWRKAGPQVEEQGQSRGRRLTACVSSQVGCPMRCSFCATGKGGFARNLSAAEIVDQVMTVREQFGKRVSNVVFMGMGEPLLNLPAVVSAFHIINEQLGVGAQRITISTVGVPNTLGRLARERLKATLAVSLHAPQPGAEGEPGAQRQGLPPEGAHEAPTCCLQRRTVWLTTSTAGQRVTYEYTLIHGVNDSVEQARELAELLRSYDLFSHVNVIPWNPVDDSHYKRPSRDRVMAFVKELDAAGVPATIRMTKGLEAAAACGQLRNNFPETATGRVRCPKVSACCQAAVEKTKRVRVAAPAASLQLQLPGDHPAVGPMPLSTAVVKALAAGRASGKFNLSNQELEEVPPELWDLNLELPTLRPAGRAVAQGGGSMGGGEGGWWEVSAPTRLDLARNRLALAHNQLAALPPLPSGLVALQAAHNKVGSQAGEHAG
ncbi:hypothetical protein QJQ45_026088, partial [Haematococcus lacustris]